MAEGVHLAVATGQRALHRERSLGDDDNRCVVAGKSMFDEGAHLFDVEGPLGNQDRVRTAGDSGVPGDPARVTTHDLDDEHTMVALRRRVQAIDRFGRNSHRCVKPEGVIGRAKIVVNGLWHAHNGKSLRGKLGCHAERVLTSNT